MVPLTYECGKAKTKEITYTWHQCLETAKPQSCQKGMPPPYPMSRHSLGYGHGKGIHTDANGYQKYFYYSHYACKDRHFSLHYHGTGQSIICVKSKIIWKYPMFYFRFSRNLHASQALTTKNPRLITNNKS